MDLKKPKYKKGDIVKVIPKPNFPHLTLYEVLNSPRVFSRHYKIKFLYTNSEKRHFRHINKFGVWQFEEQTTITNFNLDTLRILYGEV